MIQDRLSELQDMTKDYVSFNSEQLVKVVPIKHKSNEEIVLLENSDKMLSHFCGDLKRTQK